ncbi:hypothetical protein GCM10027155_04790 [Acinetobacter apis]|nr:hypothetical protein [Acinetobacter apis]
MVDQAETLSQSYEQFSTYMERLMDLFIQTGQAAIDHFTFFSVVEHEIND